MRTEVQTELDRIESNVAAAYAAAAEQGADMPDAQTTDNLAETVGSIKSVKFTKQTLDAAQQLQARENIGINAAFEAKIVAAVIESLGGNPVFGYVDENNNIIVSGNLPDGSYTVKYEMEDGSSVDIGDLMLDSNVYYTVTNTLTQCTTNNSATQVVEGGSYEATITAVSGYELESVVVTMGGVDISSTAVSGGTVSVEAVTGNIVIAAEAMETVVIPSYTNLLPQAIDTNGNEFVGTHANGGDGYEYGYRISKSTGAQSAAEGVYCTGFMPFIAGMDEYIYIKNISMYAEQAGWNNIVFYDSDKNYKFGQTFNPEASGFTLANDIWRIRPDGMTVTTGFAFFRFSAGSIIDETIVTVDEEIV